MVCNPNRPDSIVVKANINTSRRRLVPNITTDTPFGQSVNHAICKVFGFFEFVCFSHFVKIMIVRVLRKKTGECRRIPVRSSFFVFRYFQRPERGRNSVGFFPVSTLNKISSNKAPSPFSNFDYRRNMSFRNYRNSFSFFSWLNLLKFRF